MPTISGSDLRDRPVLASGLVLGCVVFVACITKMVVCIVSLVRRYSSLQLALVLANATSALLQVTSAGTIYCDPPLLFGFGISKRWMTALCLLALELFILEIRVRFAVVIDSTQSWTRRPSVVLWCRIAVVAAHLLASFAGYLADIAFVPSQKPVLAKWTILGLAGQLVLVILVGVTQNLILIVRLRRHVRAKSLKDQAKASPQAQEQQQQQQQAGQTASGTSQRRGSTISTVSLTTTIENAATAFRNSSAGITIWIVVAGVFQLATVANLLLAFAVSGGPSGVDKMSFVADQISMSLIGIQTFSNTIVLERLLRMVEMVARPGSVAAPKKSAGGPKQQTPPKRQMDSVDMKRDKPLRHAYAAHAFNNGPMPTMAGPPPSMHPDAIRSIVATATTSESL
ncbi:hypothetical protein BC831DRAFT_454042 [Entophlyctis helioformis]|nr:hypothetical protein BC831DRAFT_454042 [Entophlyctis helioformis]